MKQLNEYDTPETDCAINGSEIYASDVIEKSRCLEQRLAACRDALIEIANYNPGLTSGYALASIARKALTLTAPK